MGGAPMWRGVPVCTCMPEMLDDLAVGTPTLPTITPVQGSWSIPSKDSPSALTHTGGGAMDISISGWTAVQVWALLEECRRRGFVAWHRTRAQGFAPHVHAVMDGCPHLSGLSNPVLGTAAWQVREYHAGRNGLAGRGSDDGPRDHVGVTWWTYQQEEQQNMPTAEQIAAAVWAHPIQSTGKEFTAGAAAFVADTRVFVGWTNDAVNALPALIQQSPDSAAIANAIAASLPADLAKQVADELGKRLAG